VIWLISSMRIWGFFNFCLETTKLSLVSEKMEKYGKDDGDWIFVLHCSVGNKRISSIEN
jgi:hypothetical protein